MEPSDTSPEAEAFLLEGYRRNVTDRQAPARHVAEPRAGAARIRAQYGDVPEHEMRLRLGALRLGRETMVRAFGWDPDVEGW